MSTTEAFLYATLVYVDYKPQDPSKEFQPRGMTLITITAPISGPIAIRQGDIIIPGTDVAFGGFSALLGYKDATDTTAAAIRDRDVYLLGIASSGLQLARVSINDMTDYANYRFWRPQEQSFAATPPLPTIADNDQIYVPGSFSSGSVFFSPYFETFLMVYFNEMVDSTFYIRYLDLANPLSNDTAWVAGGRYGNGISGEDVEALIKYSWSVEQTLHTTTPGPGGFNYAGMAHPHFFNKQYFSQSLYPDATHKNQRTNEWYGPIAHSDAAEDGKNLLLSWTAQVIDQHPMKGRIMLT